MLLATVLLAVAVARAGEPAAAPARRVLLVHSYHAGYVWTDAITEGVKHGLKGTDIRLEIVYMDTKRRTSAAWKRRASQLAAEKVREFKPAVVITADDNAQALFGKDFAGRKDEPQLVFCGVNADPKTYGYPAANVTGILERPHFVQTVGLLLKILPDVKRVAVLSDDSPTSDAALKYAEMGHAPVKIVSCERPATFDEWQAAVRKCRTSADAVLLYMYHTVKKTAARDERVEPEAVLKWTLANLMKPIVCPVWFAAEDGCLCGVTHSGEEHGYRAAQMAKAIILDGKTARDFPLVTGIKGAIYVNLKAAEALKIEVPYRIIRFAHKVIN